MGYNSNKEVSVTIGIKTILQWTVIWKEEKQNGDKNG